MNYANNKKVPPELVRARPDSVDSCSSFLLIFWTVDVFVLVLIKSSKRGAVAQLEEYLNGIQGVRGSNPLSSTNFFNRLAGLPDGAIYHMSPFCKQFQGF